MDTYQILENRKEDDEVFKKGADFKQSTDTKSITKSHGDFVSLAQFLRHIRGHFTIKYENIYTKLSQERFVKKKLSMSFK